MLHIFHKTSIGYSHLKNKKLCQDYSLTYSDVDKKVIACADGHGGDIYIRSHLGSKYACESILNVFSRLSSSYFHKYEEKDIEEKIKLDILCEWNKKVERSLVKNRFKKRELEKLNEDDKDYLISNPVKAYGTTLGGALLIENILVVVSIGDTECLLINKGELEKTFDNSDDPAANVTYSMCQEDAYQYLRVKVFDFRQYDGVILCTDGLSSPFQSYKNFNQSFIKPLMKQIINEHQVCYLDNYVSSLGEKRGNGDDVSVAFIIKDTAKKKYYK